MSALRKAGMCFHVLMLLLIAGIQDFPHLGTWIVLAERECEHNLLHTMANCSDQERYKVPWGLHHSINTLDLSNNKFVTLPSLAFKSYSGLRTLSLRNNSIRSLHRDALANLNYLHTLDLSNNHFSSVPTEVLASLPGLLNLNLAGNNLMLIPDSAFVGLGKLKTLDLSGNRIEELGPEALLGLTKLQKLSLANNALRSMPPAIFQHLSPDLLSIHLQNNPWICDCQIRFMRLWMANGTVTIWQHPNEDIQCDGPSITRGKSVSDVPLDELACKVEMRTSGSTQFVVKGEEAVMECIYFSIPTASPIWQKSEMTINFDAEPDKYSMTVDGFPLTTTRLHVKDFQYEDIAEYECLAQNVRGSDFTIFRVTLQGVPFDTVSHTPHLASSSAGVDTKSIVVAVGVVCGIILLVVLSVLIFCCVNHIKRREQEKRDAVVENVKKHFLANGDMPLKENSEMDKSKFDQFNNDDTNSDSNRTNDTNATQPKQPIDAEYPNDREPIFTFQQPSSPFANGNTYMSFGSEVTEPECLQMYPQANSTMRYDGSQTESTTPLLDRYTPSVFDSDDPFDDSLQHPIYEAATLYHPRRNHFPHINGSVPPLTPGSIRSSARSTTFIPAYSSQQPDYEDYRDIRYPYNTHPDQRMLGTKKSMSVGNLGYQPAPRKPPRIFHSREYVEMSAHDTSGSASDYMTVPPQTSYYGIKPGTPV